MQRTTIQFFIVLCTILMMGSLLTACSQAEATLIQAQRELPFDVLVADPVPEDWELINTHLEDDLLVMIYESEGKDGQVEIIQDRNIQGLDLQMLRQYLIGVNQSMGPDDPDMEIVELNDFIGQVSLLEGEPITVQFTFVRKEDLASATAINIPIYQIVGKDVSAETVLQFASALTATDSTT